MDKKTNGTRRTDTPIRRAPLNQLALRLTVFGGGHPATSPCPTRTRHNLLSRALLSSSREITLENSQSKRGDYLGAHPM
jgi:hypothetical protein